MQNFFKNLNTTRTYLIIANLLLVFFLILLNNLGVLPIKAIGNFLFFTFIALIFALYRPGWAFLFFIGTIALENIIVSTPELPVQLRPYQIIGALTIIAVVTRLILKRLNFKLIKLNFADYLLLCIAVASFISSVFSLDRGVSFKQSLVLTSFVALYFLVRLFIQSIDDLKKVVPLFLSSSVIAVFYGIWQNWRFTHGLNSFEIMPGRPNSTFTEPDWLGIFLVLLLAVLYSLLYFFQERHSEQSKESSPNTTGNISSGSFFATRRIRMTSLYSLLILIYVLLVITVSRSAWLAAAVVTITFLSVFLIKKQWKHFFRQSGFIAAAILISIVLIYLLNLTDFQLFNRVKSTGTGLQKITISCDLEARSPREISSADELGKYGCRHINLEDIESEKTSGHCVTEIYRKDPNVATRTVIYKKSWEEIKKHPVFGIGWGDISEVLGKDERGAGLNSSNIFLEIWLGSGILGIASFVSLWAYIILNAVKKFIQPQDQLQKTVFLFIILSWLALTVTNLFNAGIFLGILWIYLAISVSMIKNENRN